MTDGWKLGLTDKVILSKKYMLKYTLHYTRNIRQHNLLYTKKSIVIFLNPFSSILMYDAVSLLSLIYG
jgi:hypothetical protein